MHCVKECVKSTLSTRIYRLYSEYIFQEILFILTFVCSLKDILTVTLF